jgi:hypothetical protein
VLTNANVINNFKNLGDRKMAKRPSVTKTGNTTKLRYSNGTVVEIKTIKPYSARNLGDLNDLSGKGRKRRKSKSRAKSRKRR